MTGWRALREDVDVACAGGAQAHRYSKTSESQLEQLRQRCETLFQLCCLRIAHELVRPDLGFQDKRCIVEHLIRHEMVLCVWSFIGLLSEENFALLCLLHSSKISGECLQKAHPYVRYALPLDLDLTGTIRLLNGLHGSYGFKHLTVLEIHHPVDNLPLLTNLHSLLALAVTSPRLHEVVRSWHRSLAADGTRWRNLRVLKVPQLRSPMLFFEMLRLVPSLTILEAGLAPADTGQIPALSRIVRHLEVGPRELIDAVPDKEVIYADKIVFGLSVGSSPSTEPLAYVYERQKISSNVQERVSEKPAIRRPFNKRLKTGTSVNQFFGFT